MGPDAMILAITYTWHLKNKQINKLKNKKKQETNEKRNSEGTEPCSLSQEEFMNQGKNSSWEKYLFRIGYKMYVFNRVGLSFREGNGTPLQYSCLENPMDGGVW